MRARRLLVAVLEALGTPAAPLDDGPGRSVEVLRCNVLVTLALSEFLVDGRAAAEARLRLADEVADALSDDRLRSRIALQRASIEGRSGDLSSAWQSISRALAHPDAFAPREHLALLLNRGMLAMETSQAAEALTSFREAAQRAREGGYEVQERMARHNEGVAQYLLGDVPEALRLMAEAEAVLPGRWFSAEVLDRARVLLEAGLVEDAVETLTPPDRDMGEQARQHVAEADLERARALRLQGRLRAAVEAADQARSGYERLGFPAWANRAAVVGLQARLDDLRAGATRAGGTDVDAVAVEATAAVERATAFGDPDTARAACVLGCDALLLAGRPDDARAALSSCVATSGTSLTQDLALAAVTADLAVAGGEPARAARVLASAARALTVAKSSAASIDVQTAVAVHGVRLARADTALALERGSAAVLGSLERWRAGSDRLPLLERGDDAEVAALTERLRGLQFRLHRSDDEAEAARLAHEAVLLQGQIRRLDWARRGGAGQVLARGGRVRAARDELAAHDRDLVWFFTHADRLMGLGVVRGRATVRDLGPLLESAELARRLRIDFRGVATRDLGPFAAAVTSSLREAAAVIDERLLRPWRTDRGLVLVTCQEVSALPWALLPSLRGRPLTLSASLTSWAERHRAARSSGGVRVDVSAGPGLARAVSEARDVAGAWAASGADVRLHEPSRAEQVVEALTTPGVVHVAAHGTHAVESPLFSALHAHDGPVFAHELQASGVHADHVVLSACDVGSATFRPGEEQLGLAAAMLSLGAASVVAAVSPVPDAVAADVMVRHHRALAGGVASDEALADAVADGDVAAAAFLHLGGRFVSPAGGGPAAATS